MDKLEFTNYFDEAVSEPTKKTTPIKIRFLIERAIEKSIITKSAGRELFYELF